MFEILEHTADIGFRARGATIEELFAESARALVSIAVELEDIKLLESWSVETQGDNRESLLINFLNDVLWLLDGKRLVMARFDIAGVTETSVCALAWGEPRNAGRHRSKVIVKAVTFHQLKIAQDNDGWMAEVYVDI